MPNITPIHLVLILVIALLVLGPGKLPDVGAALGKSIREFRKAAGELQESVNVTAAPTQPAASAAATAPTAAPITQPAADVARPTQPQA